MKHSDFIKNVNQPQRTAQEKGYQGWTNYETWALALWQDNDQGLYQMIQEMVAEAAQTDPGRTGEGVRGDDTIVLADMMKDFWEEMYPENLDGPWSDLLRAAWDEIDWYDIAESELAEYRLQNEE